MAKTIFVKSATKDRKVALSEGHPAHPGNHEAFVVGYPDLADGSEDPANIVEVGETPLVRRKLASGELVQVERAAPTGPEPPAEPPEPAPERPRATARPRQAPEE